jgi:hypothetical protein
MAVPRVGRLPIPYRDRITLLGHRVISGRSYIFRNASVEQIAATMVIPKERVIFFAITSFCRKRTKQTAALFLWNAGNTTYHFSFENWWR